MPEGEQDMCTTEQQPVADNDELAAQCEQVEPVATSSEAAQPEDEQHLVLKRLLVAHEAYFDVTRDYEYAGEGFEGYAEFHSIGEKYVLTKKAKLWGVEAHEYLFFKLLDTMTAVDLEHWVNFMTTKALEKVDPKPDHMSSYLTLVVIANSVDEGLETAIRKAKFHKDFKLGLRGWADLRLAVIDLSAGKVMSNAAGKKMRASLEANAGISDGTKRKSRR